MNPDTLIVGGGIVGCAIARALTKEGRRVVLLERGEIGREASWAAAGILAPIHLADSPPSLAELCLAGALLYPPLVEELRGETDIDVEYRPSGLLMPGRDGAQTLLPHVAQVRSHRMTRALAAAATRYGADLRPHCEVTGFLRVPGRITGVKTTRGDILAEETVVAAGAWSGELLKSVGVDLAVRPVRGQMVLLEGPPYLVKHILLKGDRYVVPRADGPLLLGSTTEDVGFDKRVTAAGVAGILSAALEIAPVLAELPIVQTWAGLRPATPDRLPYLGRPPDLSGLVLATGHFRNGILLAPITAALIADLIAGRTLPIDLSPFRVDR
ncbi:MAG: FAD-dependent oxidoreductase [Planctomycetes bacterium]|nr:FAD-dependent oxidoreductase [Planctomycetota bacterium]